MLQKAQKPFTLCVTSTLAQSYLAFSWPLYEAYLALARNLNLLIIEARGAINRLTARRHDNEMNLAEMQRWIGFLCGLTFKVSGWRRQGGFGPE